MAKNQLFFKCLNHFITFYAYFGLLFALFWIYCIVIPEYFEKYSLSQTFYILFNIFFLYFYIQGYTNLILTTISRYFLRTNKHSLTASDFFCPKCNSYSNNRSHHCTLCNYCVPLRDHHCFFVGVCVGSHNKRYFMLMLFHLWWAHIIGYSFIWSYMWKEIGGFCLETILKILFFNIAYLIGYINSMWIVLICLLHYLVFIDLILLSGIQYQMVKRLIRGQTQYEEKKNIIDPTYKKGEEFYRIFGGKRFFWIFLNPLYRQNLSLGNYI
ncbi:unnamed protein product [Didymodactylos carnosus]|uniref:Palmitoyltransferase n=1 Tax=Didymodactylos carnosus TaxID=1234261 RepID=A0A813XLT7_9BILA|nr:unnamed protein product [Didymodactylos carnosus]CAF3654316.1 unnamed protein product [Didymodactylos carnosus]